MLNRTASKRTVSKRTAKFVSALFASLLAGTPLTTVSHGAAGTSGECLSGPKGAAPQGSHWFYRIDYATKRHCWYVRGEDKLSQAAPAAPAPSEPAVPAPSPKRASTQRSVADAYDALPLPPRAAPVTSATSQPPTVADAPSPPTSQPAVPTRWPEPSAASAPAIPAPAANNPVATPPSAPAVAPPAAAAVPLVAADVPSKSQSSSIPMVLTVIMGALSVVGVMGSAMFGKRWTGRPEMRGAQRVNWNFADTDRAVPTRPRSGARMPRGDVPRDLRPADDPNRRIAEMLSRLARSAAT
jgi:hypothetical protein